jgi:hypothetical protein
MSIYFKCGIQDVNAVLRCLVSNAGLTKLLAGLLALATLIMAAWAAPSVTLAWDQSADPSVAGYNLYYSGASGN